MVQSTEESATHTSNSRITDIPPEGRPARLDTFHYPRP